MSGMSGHDTHNAEGSARKTAGRETSVIRTYLETKAQEPEHEWLRREPRETHDD